MTARAPLLAATALVLWGQVALAHPLTVPVDDRLRVVEVTVSPAGEVAIDFLAPTHALLAEGLLPGSSMPDDVHPRDLPPDVKASNARALSAFFRKAVRVLFEAKPAELTASFPQVDAGETALAAAPQDWVRLSGRVPEGGGRMTLALRPAMGRVKLIVRVPGRDELTRELTDPGEKRLTVRVPPPDPAAAATVSPAPQPVAPEAPAPGGAELFGQYLWLGFEHIVPLGADHILFVLGLFLLAPRLRELTWQITSFTVAHSVTLALTVAGLVSLEPEVVEPLIAASIVYVGVENALTSRLHAWRPAVVFLFGLLHGMGFAGVLGEVGLPDEGLAVSVAAFNVGVELGQLTVVAAALLAVGWLRGRPWFRARVQIPGSVAIAGVGLFWFVERVAG